MGQINIHFNASGSPRQPRRDLPTSFSTLPVIFPPPLLIILDVVVVVRCDRIIFCSGSGLSCDLVPGRMGGLRCSSG